MNEGRLAVISIGSSPVFSYIKSITNTLKIPYLGIKWENEIEQFKSSDLLLNNLTHLNDLNTNYLNYANIHLPANQLVQAVIDLIVEYNWEFVTVIYSESTGPEKVQAFIDMPYTNKIANKRFRMQVKQLSKDVKQWVYLIKDVNLILQ